MNGRRAVLGVAAVLACAPAVAAQERCQTPPEIRAVSDLRFGRLVVAERGGTAELSAGDCVVETVRDVDRLPSADSGCAEFELEGGTLNANRLVLLEIRSPRTVTFAGGAGRAQLLQFTVGGSTGDSPGGGAFQTIRLGGDGRARVSVGARLQVVDFAPGEVRAPVTVAAHYVGCRR